VGNHDTGSARISIFLALQLASIGALALAAKLREIGHEEGETARNVEQQQANG
jgi:hypothetical protein